MSLLRLAGTKLPVRIVLAIACGVLVKLTLGYVLPTLAVVAITGIVVGVMMVLPRIMWEWKQPHCRKRINNF